MLQVVEGQSMPPGLEVTRPEPLPTKVTVTRAFPGGGGGDTEKAATRSWSAPIATSQAAVPEHAPCHPSKFQPASGMATRRTVAVASIVCWQSERQLKAGDPKETSAT